jgi:rfaE bifunctional protein nucleotidyltransferase chain/domain
MYIFGVAAICPDCKDNTQDPRYKNYMSMIRKATGREVLVGTSGCFEILHAGHVKMLQAARDLGDRLVVLVNDDNYMVRVKGHCYVPLMERVAVLMGLSCVDSVVWFSEDTPCDEIRLQGIDIFVKGGEYKGVGIPEESVCKVVYIDSGVEVHSSDIIDRIKQGVTYTGACSPDMILEPGVYNEVTKKSRGSLCSRISQWWAPCNTR